MEGISQKVLPDIYPDVIFIYHKKTDVFHAELYGLYTCFIDYNYPDSVEMFGIRFRAAAMSAFTRVPLLELTDLETDLTLVDTLFDKKLNETFHKMFYERKSATEMAIYMDKYLQNLLSALYPVDKQIFRAVDLISSSKGLVSPVQVASDICLGSRHFERKFKQTIGITPKKLAKIVRFDNALDYLAAGKNLDVVSVALNCGYYDHRHLIKDFKEFADGNPSDFRDYTSS